MASSSVLQESTTRHQVYLERLKAGEVKKFESFLVKIDKDLRSRLENKDLTKFSRDRIEKLIYSVNKSLETIYEEYGTTLKANLKEIAAYEAEFEAGNIKNVSKSDFEPVIPGSRQVWAAVKSTPLSVKGPDAGKLLDTFISDFSRTEISRVNGAIRQGFFEGKTTQDIIKDIRGTKANKYTDGILNISKRNAEAITRTAVQHSATTARYETWQDNDDIVKGYRWNSTLDQRTSSQCRSLDGRVFQFGKGPKPPIHINCRSTIVAELSDEYKWLQQGRTRASKDGYVDGNQNYYEWLKTQDTEFQDDVLGKTLGKVFRDGGLSADRFAKMNLGRNFKSLTLEEMKRKEPLAFKRALDPDNADKPKPEPKPKKEVIAEYDDKPLFSGNTKAAKFSNDSFTESPKWIKDRFKGMDNPKFVTIQKGAYFKSHKNSISMAKYLQNGDDRGKSVWRHEYGHYIDYKLTPKRGDYRSSGEDFVSAVSGDSEKILSVYKREARKKIADKFSKHESKFSALKDAKDRNNYIKSLISKADIDADQFENLLKDSTIILDGIEKLGDSSPIGVQKRVSDMLFHLIERDAEKFISAANYFDMDEFKVKSQSKNGTFNAFSDLIGATTKNLVASYHDGYAGHEDGYYRKAKFFQYTEVFANLTALAGHNNPLWFEIAKRFAPDTAKTYEKIIRTEINEVK